jgi:RNA polymerase-binding transcription factor DksA
MLISSWKVVEMPSVPLSLQAEVADALRRRRAMLLSLAAESEHELASTALGNRAHRDVAVDVARLIARLDHRDQREVSAIDAALGRLDDGSYGRCERCSGDIELPRLRAVPTARACTACGRHHGPDDEPTSELSLPTRAAHRVLADTVERRRSTQPARRKPAGA